MQLQKQTILAYWYFSPIVFNSPTVCDKQRNGLTQKSEREVDPSGLIYLQTWYISPMSH
jgi:hypothetical protein